MAAGDVSRAAEVAALIEKQVWDVDHAHPALLYLRYTELWEFHSGVVRELSRRRAEVVGEMHKSGLSFARIGVRLGMSRARAQQMVERSRTDIDRTPIP